MSNTKDVLMAAAEAVRNAASQLADDRSNASDDMAAYMATSISNGIDNLDLAAIVEPLRATTGVPNFDAIKDLRMSEMTPEQQRDAQELWLRNQIGWFTGPAGEQLQFLLTRLDEARSQLALLTEQQAKVPEWAYRIPPAKEVTRFGDWDVGKLKELKRGFVNAMLGSGMSYVLSGHISGLLNCRIADMEQELKAEAAATDAEKAPT